MESVARHSDPASLAALVCERVQLRRSDRGTIGEAVQNSRFDLNVLRRIRHTPQQHKLPPSERRKNMRGAFVAKTRKELAGSTVLLVDDVLTTGSTCHDAAKALKAAGAKRVIVAVVARGEDVRTAVIENK